MKPVEVPFSDPGQVLSGAQFADSYILYVDGQRLDEVSAAERVVGRQPRWIMWLLALRNIVVRPLNLKPGVNGRSDIPRIGIFPLLQRSPGRLVMGLDDRHLDFRFLLDVQDIDGGRQSVTVSTIVKTHNLLGRIYLACVLPFHRVIVKTMLAQVAKA